MTFQAIRYFLLLSLIVGCSLSSEKLYTIAPTTLAQTDRVMKTSGFWISRHPSPDKVILTAQQIEEFNAHTKKELKLIKDIGEFPSQVSGIEFKRTLQKSLEDFSKQKLYGSYGRRVPSQFYKNLQENMNFDNIPEVIDVQFGFIVHFADQKLLPTFEDLHAKPKDIDFDELQNSGLDVGTPVAVLHHSQDGQWLYVESPLSSGWVNINDVAFCDHQKIKDFLTQSFVVVTAPKADIFWDMNRTEYYDFVRMGVRLPVMRMENSRIVCVLVATRQKDGDIKLRQGYIKSEHVHEDFLVYTPRNIIEQAFQLLNAPYGWGDVNGEQDCSRFLQEIFATVGVSLPRNSSAQKEVGRLVAKFEKNVSDEQKVNVLVNQTIAGTSLLYLKGHIMLFLGIIDGRPYAIHAPWAYRERGFLGQDRVRVINRVVVTDLSLGEGSKKGSLLKRLKVVTRIGN